MHNYEWYNDRKFLENYCNVFCCGLPENLSNNQEQLQIMLCMDDSAKFVVFMLFDLKGAGLKITEKKKNFLCNI